MSHPDPVAGKAVCDVPLEAILQTGFLDITESATPGRYRLISCAEFIQEQRVVILEYAGFPEVPYAALSYVWQGNTPDKGFDGHVFNVPVPEEEGASPGDPIGAEVLREACAASSARGATHLWIDRLCIMQKNKRDKRWQIGRMYEIYRRCRLCVVAPGGLQCLVRLDEETQWIHRGWTLQEAVAPPAVDVLFSWALGSRRAWAGDLHGSIDEVTPRRSAMMPLSLIVDACTTGSLSVENGATRLLLQVKLFSSHPADRSYRDFPFWGETRRVLSPNVGALARIMSRDLDRDAREHSIWQSALMRTSSRPVDMVFSIMGLFGITLDTSQFGKQDRVQATIALARAILEKGGRATWLAAAFRIPPSRQISTFPLFPRTSVSGKAFVKVTGGLLEVSSMMENEYPNTQALVPMPSGSINSEGYLNFSSKAIPIRPHSPSPAQTPSDPEKPTYFQAVDESWWKIRESGASEESETFAVLIGFFVGYYPGSTPASDTNNIRTAIVEKHAQGRYRVRSYLALSIRTRAWVQGWPEQAFSVGGPVVSVAEDLGENMPVISVPREQYLNNPWSKFSDAVTSLEDKTIRRSRWAVPQKALERQMK